MQSLVVVLGERFFTLYRQREDHSQLDEHTPDGLHHQQLVRRLAPEFQMPTTKLPLREGRIHFMRQVTAAGTVRVLNVDWVVPRCHTTQGVWVTVDLRSQGATLSIYDAAPDAEHRQRLAAYPFPLKEPVLPTMCVIAEATTCSSTATAQPTQQTGMGASLPESEQVWNELELLVPSVRLMTNDIAKASERLILSTLTHTARLTRKLIFTMY